MAQLGMRALARLGFGASLVALTTAFSAGSASAQQPASGEAGPQQAADTAAPVGETVVITGYRESLRAAIEEKRDADVMLDAINAEDIANFPDANLAESIQRLPGVSIDRDNGEGRSITVRGLGGDFQQVRLNGADALSISGGNQSDSGANRSRGFDF